MVRETLWACALSLCAVVGCSSDGSLSDDDLPAQPSGKFDGVGSAGADAGAVVADPDAGPPGPCEFSAYENLFGLNVSAFDPVYLDDAEALGVRWLRVELRTGQVSLAQYRDIADQAHARGFKVLYLVGYMLTPGKPAWNAPAAEWNTYRANFNIDLAEAGDALGDVVDAWEVWNEPDHQLSGGYDPGVPAQQFGYLLRDAAEILRARSNGLLVVGGLATKRFNYYINARTAAGGVLDYDGVGVHTYGPPFWTVGIVKNEIDTVIDDWYAVTQLPLWLTEAGAVATPDAESFAVSYVNELFSRVWNHHQDQVAVINYFSWSDAVGFASERFGLVRLDGSHKPSFDTYAALSPDHVGEICPPPGAPQL